MHAKDIASGYFKRIKQKHRLSPEQIREIGEVRAMIYTNAFRKEQGIKEVRTTYLKKKLLKDDGITPIKDYGFDVSEGLFPKENKKKKN